MGWGEIWKVLMLLEFIEKSHFYGGVHKKKKKQI